MDDYDVIIVGTGAGGGTLARHLAPSGQADPPARARRLAPARAGELARAGRVRRQPLRLAGHLVRRRRASRSSRRSTTSSAARRSSTAPRSTGCARRTSASSSHHDGISPAWPISYDELEPYYTLAEQHYEVHGARGEDPTEPPASAPYPFPAVSHEPRIQQLSDDLEAAGYHPFHAPCGVRARRGEHAVQRVRPLRELRRLPLRRAREVGRGGARRAAGARARERHAADERAGRCRLETNAGRHRGDRGRGRARRRDRALRGRHRRRSPAAPRTPRSCCCVSANDKHPNGLANGSDQVGRNYMFHNSQAVLALSREENPTIFQKTLGLNDFYLGERRVRVPAREHPDGRQVAGADVPRREAGRDEARAGVDARAGREARDRLLALDRGPAAPGQPRHASTATASYARATRRRTTCRSSSSTRSSSRCSASST